MAGSGGGTDGGRSAVKDDERQAATSSSTRVRLQELVILRFRTARPQPLLDAERLPTLTAAPASGRRDRRRPRTAGVAAFLSFATLAGFATAAAEPASAAVTHTTVHQPRAMSYTSTAEPSRNFASAADLRFSRSQYKTYLAFDTSSIKAKSTVVSAQLEMSVTSSTATQPGLEVRTTGTAWKGATITAANAPAPSSTVVNPGDRAVPKANTRVVAKLTDLAGKPVSTSLGLQLRYNVTGVPIRLSKTNPPVLRLVTAEPSAAAVATTTTTTTATTSPTPSPTPTPTVTPTTPTATVASTGSTQRPYTTPAVNATTKKVFAHYFPPYPISLDNRAPEVDYYARNYLNPLGEGGKFQSVGGLLRDRPVGRPVLAGDYKAIDLGTEVRQAADAGVDGFLTNIMNITGTSWTQSLLLSEAAAKSGTGFTVAPNIDMTATISTVPVPTIASKLAEFYRTPGAYRLPDGRYVLSTFKAEAKSVTYWRSLIAELKNVHGIDVAWVGVMLSLSEAQVQEYAPISYALGVWGARDADLTMRMANRAATAHKFGVKYIAPIAVQDVRHTKLTYAESNNTELLRASWQRAISDGADFAQLITWNDYSESTSFAPSASHRQAFLDVSGYYAHQFRKGVQPTLSGDELVVTHRIQKTTTKPLIQTGTMTYTLAGSKTLPRDTVEVYSLLKAPATITLNVGTTTRTVEAPAGPSTFTLPLTTGAVSAKAVRSGTTVATVTSPNLVKPSIDYWNLQYYAATSRENPTP